MAYNVTKPPLLCILFLNMSDAPQVNDQLLSTKESPSPKGNDPLKDVEEPQASEACLAGEVEKTIARYIVEAPCNEVRDILRLHSTSKTYDEQKASFNTHNKVNIIKTLKFLGDNSKIWSSQLKDDCLHGLVSHAGGMWDLQRAVRGETVRSSSIIV